MRALRRARSINSAEVWLEEVLFTEFLPPQWREKALLLIQ